jgi:hypothetical protein
MCNVNVVFINICNLPDSIIDIIKSYIPKITTMFLSKQEYITNHVLLKPYISKQNIEIYYRNMIRQDNDFVFSNILVENYERWLKIKQYYYKQSIYMNYIYFLISYCIEYESPHCKTLIIQLLIKNGLYKNQHKKNYVTYIR